MDNCKKCNDTGKVIKIEKTFLGQVEITICCDCEIGKKIKENKFTKK